MGTYKVQSDGNAPKGLGLGDLVVTGGGTYLITGFKSDGSYQSKLVDKATTTYNYSGSYDTPGGNYNSGGSANNSSTLSNLTQQFVDTLNQVTNSSYSGYQQASLPEVKTLSYDDAMSLAEKIMSPQYQESYEQSAANASQRLERAGLYDTVYGQSLAAEAERDVSRDLNTAIVSLALQLSNASEQKAQDILELSLKESQFAANYDAEQKNTALKYLQSLLS